MAGKKPSDDGSVDWSECDAVELDETGGWCFRDTGSPISDLFQGLAEGGRASKFRGTNPDTSRKLLEFLARRTDGNPARARPDDARGQE